MAEIELLMPSLGESVMEGTVLTWLKNEGDTIDEEESILEVATDKVDTEIPSIYGGTIKKIIVREGEVAQVGKPLAVIDTNQEITAPSQANGSSGHVENTTVTSPAPAAIEEYSAIVAKSERIQLNGDQERFYSPLVKSIAKQENIDQNELDMIPGTGKDGRVTKKDLFSYLAHRKTSAKPSLSGTSSIPIPFDPEKDTVQKMDRMRKIIAERMLESKRISAHVTSFIEADVTNIMSWRKEVKHDFNDKYGAPLSLNAIIMDIIASTLIDYPVLNSSLDGENIIFRKEINLGMAVALSDGNLIVPVIKNADKIGISGIAKTSFDLAQRARTNDLKADDLTGGTYSVSNIGTFNNVMGTPIIMQPQVAILAIGTAEKKPVVVETPEGDIIGIRQKMFLSHTYDHRLIDGMVGGSFLKDVAEKIRDFDTKKDI